MRIWSCSFVCGLNSLHCKYIGQQRKGGRFLSHHCLDIQYVPSLLITSRQLPRNNNLCAHLLLQIANVAQHHSMSTTSPIFGTTIKNASNISALPISPNIQHSTSHVLWLSIWMGKVPERIVFVNSMVVSSHLCVFVLRLKVFDFRLLLLSSVLVDA